MTRYRSDAEQPQDSRQGSVEGMRLIGSGEDAPTPHQGTPPVQPVMVVRKNAAYRGVYWRLIGAALSGFVTAIALATLMFSFMPTFVFMVAVVIAGAGGLITITLAMSARKEEEVHQLAASLQRPNALLEDSSSQDAAHQPSSHSRGGGTDGEVERRWTAEP